MLGVRVREWETGSSKVPSEAERLAPQGKKTTLYISKDNSYYIFVTLLLYLLLDNK